jgi:hypothetical protein
MAYSRLANAAAPDIVINANDIVARAGGGFICLRYAIVVVDISGT